jgi:hypothetical protein
LAGGVARGAFNPLAGLLLLRAIWLPQDLGHTPNKGSIIAKAADLVGLIMDLPCDGGKLSLEFFEIGSELSRARQHATGRRAV